MERIEKIERIIVNLKEIQQLIKDSKLYLKGYTKQINDSIMLWDAILEGKIIKVSWLLHELTFNLYLQGIIEGVRYSSVLCSKNCPEFLEEVERVNKYRNAVREIEEFVSDLIWEILPDISKETKVFLEHQHLTD